MSGAGLPVIATWYPDADGDGTPDGPAVATQTLATTASAGTIVGQVLWPGAAVDENGVGIAWPGWRRASFGETPMWENYVLDPTLPEAVLLDGALVVISINPEATISLAYPDGDVDLLPALEVDKAVDRSAAHRAEQITYTLTVRSAGYGATDDVVLRDELPPAPRVLEVEVADQADPTQPTWDCRVTDRRLRRRARVRPRGVDRLRPDRAADLPHGRAPARHLPRSADQHGGRAVVGP